MKNERQMQFIYMQAQLRTINEGRCACIVKTLERHRDMLGLLCTPKSVFCEFMDQCFADSTWMSLVVSVCELLTGAPEKRNSIWISGGVNIGKTYAIAKPLRDIFKLVCGGYTVAGDFKYCEAAIPQLVAILDDTDILVLDETIEYIKNITAGQPVVVNVKHKMSRETIPCPQIYFNNKSFFNLNCGGQGQVESVIKARFKDQFADVEAPKCDYPEWFYYFWILMLYCGSDIECESQGGCIEGDDIETYLRKCVTLMDKLSACHTSRIKYLSMF